MSNSDNKVYVGNLANSTNKETLTAHFLQYGDISECVVMMDKDTGTSRGFGFVTFKESSAVDAAIGNHNMVDGKQVQCKRAVRDTSKGGGQDDGRSNSGGGSQFNVVKVFVGGLPASCDYDKLVGHFSRYGEIQDAVVMMDAQTQRHRGFGFVTYKDPNSVEAALREYKEHKIDNKWIEVKRCQPQDVMRGPGGGGGGGGRKGDRADDDGPSLAPAPAYGAPPPGYPMGPPGAPPGYPPAGYYPPAAYGGYYASYYQRPPAYPGYPGYPGYPPAHYPPPPEYYAAYGYPPPSAEGYPGFPPPAAAPTSAPSRSASRSRSRGRRRR